MANNIYLISTINGTTTNYYLSGPGQEYTGSGTPWTSQSTSPYEIAMNDVSGPLWAPVLAPTVAIYSGGPPFRAGRTLIGRSYDNVTETVAIQVRANNHDNAVALLQKLRQIIKASPWNTPCVLAVQPNGSTNIVYFDVYDGDIQESTFFINKEAGRGILRAQMTITRSFAGGRLSTGETLINAATFKNTGTGSPDNVDAYSTGSGDMIYEGQPLNIKMSSLPVGYTITRVYASSIHSRTYSTTMASTVSTSSTTFQAGASISNIDISAILTRTELKPRFLAFFSNITSNLEARLEIRLDDTSGDIITTTRSFTRVSSSAQSIIDFGTWPLQMVRRSRSMTTPRLSIQIWYRSTDGASAGYTITHTEFLLYNTFAVIIPNTQIDSNEYMLIDQFAEHSGSVCLPHDTPITIIGKNTGDYQHRILRFQGVLPRYYAGTSLYLSWLATAGAYDSTVTGTVTATHAPLYRTLRGNG